MAVNVDATQHVARYCSSQKIDRKVQPAEPMPFAFALREGKETFLSVNHCEHHSGARLDQLRSILGDLTAKGYGWSKSGGFSVLNSGKVLECGEARDRALRVRRRHHHLDRSYASIEGLPVDNSDSELLALLATKGSVEFHLVADIP